MIPSRFVPLLKQWTAQRRDVSYPVFVDDAPSTFQQYGFSDDAQSFSRGWELDLASDARVRAAFTGTAFAHRVSADEYYLDLRTFAPRPIQPIPATPSWYPFPVYARYGSFTRAELEALATNLLTDQQPQVQALHSPMDDEASVIAARMARNARRYSATRANHRAIFLGADATREELVELFVSSGDTGVEEAFSGIPVAAGELLIRRGGLLRFSLHPERALPDDRQLEDHLVFSPNHYLELFRDLIGDAEHYPAAFRSNALGPPLFNGTFHYVKQTPDAAFPTAKTSLNQAIAEASECDTILVLDKAPYILTRDVDRYVSILGRVPANDDARDLKTVPVEGMPAALAARYPRITNGGGRRGVYVRYQRGTPRPPGFVYLANLAIAGHVQDVAASRGTDSLGGAGILISGKYYEGDPDSPELGRNFSRVHVDNCAIVDNTMSNYGNAGVETLRGGGGILCYYSSPLISRCLISDNGSYFHGAGIGVMHYSWPVIRACRIQRNRAQGHPTHDGEGRPQPGGNGDGGGIGIFLAYPEHRHDSVVAGAIGDLLLNPIDWTLEDGRQAMELAWDRVRLGQAREKRVYIADNEIVGNRAAMGGGGVYTTVLGLLSMSGNLIEGNFAERDHGGGVSVSYGSELWSSGDEIRSNFAIELGGGVYVRSARVELSDATVQSNAVTATAAPAGFGGGIAVVARPEILGNHWGPDRPDYDVLLGLIFVNIGRVELALTGSRVIDNDAPNGGTDVWAHRDVSEYDDMPRWPFVLAGLIREVPLHLRADDASTTGTTPSDVRVSHRDAGGTLTVVSIPTPITTPFEFNLP